ncbi:cellulose binding domain-containing protein [Actinomadura welshii]
MSGEEPGYVPPDHKTTAEFRAPGGAAEPGAGTPGAEATFVDEPVDASFDVGATLQDFGTGERDVPFGALPADDPGATFQDARDDGPSATAVEAPATLTDGSAAVDASVTATDVPVSRPPEAAVFAMPAPDYAQSPAPEQATPPEQAGAFEQAGAPEPVTVPEQAGAPEQVTAPEDAPAAMHEQPPAFATGPQAAPPPPAPEEGPWTEQFSAEAEAAHPEAAHPEAAGPAFAYAMPGTPPHGAATPPEATAPAMAPAASPSGGVPPSGPSGSRRPILLIALISAAVVLLAAAGVTVLLLTGGSGKDDKATTGNSPVASAPATEGGGGAAPAPSSGAPSEGAPPSGAPAAPPAGGPSGPPPGQQPASPPVPTAPIGPVMQGNGITYQLVQQDEGYFEGRMIITNRTDEPMKTWKLTFRTPGADVKNIWGAELVKGGEKVEIKNLDDAPAIPPGATWDVQFGAAGITTTPEGCRLNGKACGF